jgi:hypothetical protein
LVALLLRASSTRNLGNHRHQAKLDVFRRWEYNNAHIDDCLALAALLGANGGASAQHMGTKQEQSACSRDAQRFCRKDLGDEARQSEFVLQEGF